jgi:hypothetical protein
MDYRKFIVPALILAVSYLAASGVLGVSHIVAMAHSALLGGSL